MTTTETRSANSLFPVLAVFRLEQYVRARDCLSWRGFSLRGNAAAQWMEKKAKMATKAHLGVTSDIAIVVESGTRPNSSD